MKVELISRVWNKPVGTILNLTGAKLDLVLRKNYAREYKEKAIEKAPQNKAIGKSKKRK